MDNKIKKSKWEPEDRTAAGVIRVRRVNGEQEDRAAAWGNKRKKSKVEQEEYQQQG